MSNRFIKDVSSNTYSVKPVVVINNNLYLSTHSLNIDGVTTYNIVKDIPRVNEKIELLEEGAIQIPYLSISLMNYGKSIEGYKTFSALYGDRGLSDKSINVYYISQNTDKLEDSVKVFTGFIRKATHTKETFTIQAESLSLSEANKQILKDSEINIAKYPLARDKDLGRTIPVSFGVMDQVKTFPYNGEIITSSPELEHLSLINQKSRIGTKVLAVTPLSVYSGGYHAVTPGLPSFISSNSGVDVSFENIYYDASNYEAGGESYSDFSTGSKLNLSTPLVYVLVQRKPTNVEADWKSPYISHQIVKNYDTTNPDVIEASRDWYSLDLQKGSGEIVLDKIEQYMRSTESNLQDLPDSYKNVLLDVNSDQWVGLKGTIFLANEDVDGTNGYGRFETESPTGYFIFTFPELSSILGGAFKPIEDVTKHIVLTKYEVKGAFLPIITLSSVNVGAHSFSAGDQLIYECNANLNMVIQAYPNSLVGSSSGGLDVRAPEVGIENYTVLNTASIDGYSTEDENKQTYDNVYNNSDPVDYSEYGFQQSGSERIYSELYETDKISLGLPEQISHTFNSNNGWKGDSDSSTTVTPYANPRFNIETKFYGMETMHAYEAAIEELDLFCSINGVAINKYIGNLDNFHYTNQTQDYEAMRSNHALILITFLQKYSDLLYKLDGDKSLKSAVQYNLSNWYDTYDHLPSSVKSSIDTILQLDNFYKTRSPYEARADFYIDSITTLKAFIDQLARESCFIPFLSSSSNVLQFLNICDKYTDETIANYKEDGSFVYHRDLAHHLRKKDIIDYKFELSNIDKVANTLNVKFNYDAATTDYKYEIKLTAREFLSNYSNTYYGQKEEDLELRTYKRPEAAIRFATQYLLNKCNRHLEVDLKLPVKFMYLNVGDLLIFDEVLGNDLPYNIDYTKDFINGEPNTVNGQQIFKYFIITETNKDTRGVSIKAMQTHDLAPFLDFGVIGCTATPGDIINGMLCVNSPDNFNEDATVSDNNLCNHVVGCADPSASNYSTNADGQAIDENGNVITLHNPSVCTFEDPEEIEDDEENEVEDPDDEAVDDSQEDYALNWNYKSHRVYYTLIGQNVTGDLDLTPLNAFTVEESLVFENLIPIEFGYTWENSTDGAEFEDLLHTTDSITNTADSKSFGLDLNLNGGSYYDLQGDLRDFPVYIIKTNGQSIRLSDISTAYIEIISNNILGLTPPGDYNTLDGDIATLETNALWIKQQFKFQELYNSEAVGQIYQTWLDEGLIDVNGKINFKLTIKANEETFIDTSGNIVEPGDANKYFTFNFSFTTDLRPDIEGAGIYLGDVNSDNTINILDMVSMTNFILSNVDYTEYQEIAADVNKDGTTNILDIVEVINSVLNYAPLGTINVNIVLSYFDTYTQQDFRRYSNTLTPIEDESFKRDKAIKIFKRQEAECKVYAITSPDGQVYFNLDTTGNIESILNSGDFNNIDNTLGTIQNTALNLSGLNYNGEEREQYFNFDPDTEITYITKKFTFTQQTPANNYIILVTVIKEVTGEVTYFTKPVEVIA